MKKVAILFIVASLIIVPLWLEMSGNTDSSDEILEDDEYPEPGRSVQAYRGPDDPDLNKTWGLHNTGQTGGIAGADIDALRAWELQTGSSGEVIIAVIDSGVDYTHPDLAANIWTNPGEIPGNGVDDDLNGFVDDVHGWDFVNNDNDPSDDDNTGHGTHGAGIIGALGNNSIGIAGVNWNVKIMPLKFLASDGLGTIAGAISSIDYATMMGAHIISNSWGVSGDNQDEKDIQDLKAAILAANDSGILFIASAGDYRYDIDNSPYYPAGYDIPNVVSVAATDHNDTLSFLSNYGATTVDLAAPGVEIYSTAPGSSYAIRSGTSMATSYVAGVAGLIKAQNPELTSEGLKAKLLVAVDPIPSLERKTLTGGRLNAYNCLENDTVPPFAASDLAINDNRFYSVTLSWTATGDDGDTGIAKSYDIRYSTSPINDRNWDFATKAVGEPKPQNPGSFETFTITGLLNSTKYYFALKVIDNVGNPSGLSDVSETTTTPVIVFKDNMENGIGEWTHSGAGDNWQLGSPISGPEYAYSDSNVWATNLSGYYGTNFMNASLISPLIDLSGIRFAQLSFQHFYNTQTDYDGAIVEISSDGGSSWTQIIPYDGYTAIIDKTSDNPLGPVPAYSSYVGANWHEAVFDISAFDGKKINVRFRFGTDRVISRFSGWYIDDVVVRGEVG